MYDIDAALHSRSVIYWRVPQYTQELRPDDRVLIWRAGKEAGFVGWGVFVASPAHYDLSGDDDPFVKTGLREEAADWFAPVRVWPALHVPKELVATVLPEHRIVAAPMGTVFRLDADEVEALRPLLSANGYDLDRVPEVRFAPLPVRPETATEAKPKEIPFTHARITPALFLLSSTPEQPVEITIEGDALRLLLVQRAGMKTLDDRWDAVGVYLLLGKPVADDSVMSVYVGRAGVLRSRVRTGHDLKEWTRALLIQREGLQPFNSSDLGWLERRLIDVLLEAPEIDLMNKTPPPQELVPDYKAEILERTVVAALGVLGVLGAYVV
jgi:hypothetical protein